MGTRTVSNANLSKEERVRQRLYVESKQDGGNPSEFLEMLAYVVEERIWEPLGISFRELIEAPYPKGIGSSKEEIETMRRLHHKHEDGNPQLRKRMEDMRQKVWDELNPGLAKHGGDRSSKGGAQVDSINLTNGGTSETYALRRLKRDSPDLAERVIKGELSANAAAIEAGFRPRTATFYPDDANRTVRILLKHFDAEELCRAIKGTAG